MTGQVDLRGGYGNKAVEIVKARGFVAPRPGQLKTWGATAAVGGGAAALSANRRKHGDRRSGAAAGGVAGAAAADTASGVGGWALREHKESIKRGVPRTKASRKELSAHKVLHGVVEGPGKNPPNAFYRNYPPGQPAYKLERALGWKNNKYVVAGTLAAAGGAGAAYGGRKVHKSATQLTRNGKNVLHMEAANPAHRKIWGAPARMLVVGSGEKLPSGRILLPTRRQWANWGGGAALAVGGKKVIDHNVGKRDGDRRRAVAGGAVAGAGATDLAMNVAGWGTREGIKYHESLVNSGKIGHPMSRKARGRRLDEHKALHGVGSNTKDAPQAYYRQWPKELPGAKARQLMGWKNHPPVVGSTLATGTAIGAGVGLYRSRRRKVAKAETTRDRRRAAATGAAAATGGIAGTVAAYGYGDARQVGMGRKASAVLAGHGVASTLSLPLRPTMWRSSAGRKVLRQSVLAPAVTGAAVGAAIGGRKRRREPVKKVDTTMSDREAHRLATQYDTRGPLPKTLSRDEKMKAYEARYIASGGKKAEKWKHRAEHAEVGRNIGLAGVTAAGAATIGRKAPLLRRIPRHAIEHAAVASGTFGGASELYGEHARSRRASYQNSPGGVAGSALSRMQAYTPGRKS